MSALKEQLEKALVKNEAVEKTNLELVQKVSTLEDSVCLNSNFNFDVHENWHILLVGWKKV